MNKEKQKNDKFKYQQMKTIMPQISKEYNKQSSNKKSSLQQQLNSQFSNKQLSQQQQQQAFTFLFWKITNRKKLIILFLINMMILGQAYNAIPFIFSQPYFVCHKISQKGQKISYYCSQKQACLLKPYKLNQSFKQPQQYFTTELKFNTPSFITQYQLYCDKKVIGAHYQSINFSGHFMACFFLIILANRTKPSKFIHYSAITSLIVGVSILITAFSNIEILQVMFFVWAFFIQFPNSFIPSSIPYYFKKQKHPKYLSLTHLVFPLYCTINPIAFYISSSWRTFIIYVLTIPSLLLAYFYRSLDGKIEKIHKDQQQKQLQQQINQFSFVDIYKSEYFVAFLALIMISFYPYFTGVSTIIALNRLSGNFIFNFQFANIGQVLSSMISLICLKYFKPSNLLLFFNVWNAFFFILSSYLPGNLQSPCLILGKCGGDATWGVVSTYICVVLPKKFMMSIHSVRFCFMLFMSSLFPYFNYLGWLWDFDIFFAMGIFQLSIFYFVYICQKTKNSINRRNSNDF